MELFTCDKCSKSFNTKKGLRKHYKSCGVLVVFCEECGHGFNNVENYRRHIHGGCGGLGIHEDRKIGETVCEFCSKIFSNKENYKRHVVHCEKLEGVDLQAEYDLGATREELALKYGVSVIFIDKNKLIKGKHGGNRKKKIKDNSITEKKEKISRRVYSEEIIEEWKQLSNSGVTYKEIAELYGISKKPVQRYLGAIKEILVCVECGEEFLNKENYRRHIKMGCEGRGKVLSRISGGATCEDCGCFFKNRENYRRHINGNCEGKGPLISRFIGSVTCEFCNKVFENRENHKRHVSICERLKDIDIQKEYDGGASIASLAKKYNVANSFLIDNKVTVSRNRVESYQITKDKTPELFFYGGKKKISDGEKRFKEYLEKNCLYKDFNIVHQFRRGVYSLDFAFVDIKLDVEIDGSQHITEESIVSRDEIRNKYLINLGWSIYRISSELFLKKPNVVFDEFLVFLNDYVSTNEFPILVKTYTAKDILEIIEGREYRKKEILESGVDFSEKGWSDEIGKLLDITPYSVTRWMSKYMPDFYDTCWKVSRTETEE